VVAILFGGTVQCRNLGACNLISTVTILLGYKL
jgi:hypothetical protein